MEARNFALNAHVSIRAGYFERNLQWARPEEILKAQSALNLFQELQHERSVIGSLARRVKHNPV